jgi:hypothetical protein
MLGEAARAERRALPAKNQWQLANISGSKSVRVCGVVRGSIQSMNEAPQSSPLRPAGWPDGEPTDGAPVNLDPILQSILGRRGERFGLAAVVLRGGRIIAQGVAGVRKRGGSERITLDDQFHLGSCGKAMTALLKPDTFAELHPAAPAKTYSAGWVIYPASWAKGPRPGDTGRRLWHAGSNGRWNCVVSIAPEIDFAVLVACNRGPDIAVWKTHRAARTLIQEFASRHR